MVINFPEYQGYYLNPSNPNQRYYMEHQIGRLFHATKTTEASASFCVMIIKHKDTFGFRSLNSSVFIPLVWKQNIPDDNNEIIIEPNSEKVNIDSNIEIIEI